MTFKHSGLEQSMKFASWYGISVGTLIILQWIFFISTGAVPEFRTTPWSISFHLAAEISLALALLMSGVAALRSKPWGTKALMVALGMAVYSEINSPGYFAQLGQWLLVGMFLILLLGATFSIRLLLQQGNQK
jgi:hypothetical protein